MASNGGKRLYAWLREPLVWIGLVLGVSLGWIVTGTWPL